MPRVDYYFDPKDSDQRFDELRKMYDYLKLVVENRSRYASRVIRVSFYVRELSSRMAVKTWNA